MLKGRLPPTLEAQPLHWALPEPPAQGEWDGRAGGGKALGYWRDASPFHREELRERPASWNPGFQVPGPPASPA